SCVDLFTCAFQCDWRGTRMRRTAVGRSAFTELYEIVREIRTVVVKAETEEAVSQQGHLAESLLQLARRFDAGERELLASGATMDLAIRREESELLRYFHALTRRRYLTCEWERLLG